MNNYESLGRKGEQQFWEYAKQDERFQNIQWRTDDPFSIYDFEWETNGRHFYGEVKGRNFTPESALAKQGLYFEGYKALNLLPYVYAGNEARYINIFEDGSIYMWNVKDVIGLPIHWLEMNHRTAEENTKKVIKGVFTLDLDKAIKLK